MKKVLVTGATGFIGNYVVKELCKYDCTVIASSSNREKAIQAGWFDRVTYIPFDLVSFDDAIDYYAFFDKPDIVIHLAWEGLPNYKSSFHEEINLPRHLSFITNLTRNGLTDLTITGTCFEYGMREGCLDEEMPSLPGNSYGRAKNMLRQELEKLKQQYTYSFKWTRLFYMYGEGQNPNSLLSQLNKALERGEKLFNMSGGNQVRDYLPVEKVAENIVKIATQQKIDGIINNCSGEPITVKAFVEQYLEKINKHIILNFGYYPYPDYEPMRFWGDVTKLKKAINK